MIEDEQGFLYPKVLVETCVNCHLCEKVCPVINQNPEPLSPRAYAVVNHDESIQMSSSSGGVFHALAAEVICRGGVVFGVKFNSDWEAVHDYTETVDGLTAFQGSKYVQSAIGSTYELVEQFLKAGRTVMFAGTPCQIAGLRLYLRKDYGNMLLTVDVACHGVPSPKVWREYLHRIARPEGAPAGKNTVFSSLKDKPVITGISFRDKRNGWEKYGFSVLGAATEGSGKNSVFPSFSNNDGRQELLYEPMMDNQYMKAFLNDLSLRPSCYACPAKNGKSGSDITLADYWGISGHRPDLYNAKGVSLVLTHNDYSDALLHNIPDIRVSCTEYSDAVRANSAIVKSVAERPAVAEFWRIFSRMGISAALQFGTTVKPPFKLRIKRFIGKHTPGVLMQLMHKIRKR